MASPPPATCREEPGLSTTRFTVTVMRIKNTQKQVLIRFRVTLVSLQKECFYYTNKKYKETSKNEAF